MTFFFSLFFPLFLLFGELRVCFWGFSPTFRSFGRIRQSGVLFGFISLFCVGVVSEDSGRLETRVTARFDLFDFFIISFGHSFGRTL